MCSGSIRAWAWNLPSAIASPRTFRRRRRRPRRGDASMRRLTIVATLALAGVLAHPAASSADQRVDVNAADADGSTALHWAVWGDSLETTGELIRAGANVVSRESPQT